MPQETPECCEIWLCDDETRNSFSHFITYANSLNLEYNHTAKLYFPERTVVLAKINRDLFHQLLSYVGTITECRLARQPADFFTDLQPCEQVDWVKNFLEHTVFVSNPSVSICILDSGVNNAHRLLAPVLKDDDMHTADSTWGKYDHLGHGTGMAGVAAYGNLAELLSTTQDVTIKHCLESCKIFAPQNDLSPQLYGLVTVDAVTQAKNSAPSRKRQVCMAVTAPSPFAERGEPTSWSAAIDSLAVGVEGDTKYLILLSAGNIPQDEYSRYPDANLTQMIEDPAQSWNALTVGAYTELDQVDDYEVLASKGQLSPFSRTSAMWESKWPAKPEVVFEGGNIAKDASGNCFTHESLSVLTSAHQVTRHQFSPFNATSAATAEAAWFAAQIQERYPELWPETVRGLIVHSAEWSPAMKRQFAPSGTKSENARLRRICGYGVPSLERALHCMDNTLVLVAERELQPYRYYDTIEAKFKDGYANAFIQTAMAYRSTGGTW